MNQKYKEYETKYIESQLTNQECNHVNWNTKIKFYVSECTQ